MPTNALQLIEQRIRTSQSWRVKRKRLASLNQNGNLETTKEKRLPKSKPDAKANCNISDMRSCMSSVGNKDGASTNELETNTPLDKASKNCTPNEYKSLGIWILEFADDGADPPSTPATQRKRSGKNAKRTRDATTSLSDKLCIL